MNKAIENVLGYVKKHLIAVIAYSIALIALLVTALCLLSWARSGDAERVVSVKGARLVALDKDNPPTLAEEYIVGQQFDTHGWALAFDGKTVMLNTDDIYEKYVEKELAKHDDIEAGSEQYNALLEKLTKEGTKYDGAIKELEKVTVATEFGSAFEHKRVRITYKKSDYLSYMAEVDGRALYVRAVEVRSYPEYVDMSSGAPVIGEGFSVAAVLGNKPETDAFGEYEEVRGGWKINLTPAMYTVSVVSDDSLDGFYTMSLVCGDVSTEFSFYNAAEQSFVVSSKNNVVKYTTDAADKALTLVVTERSEGYQLDCKGKSSGKYIYTRGENSTVYDFGYELDGKNEIFASESAVDDGRDADGYTATVDGTAFRAQTDVWQGAVVNGIIVDDSGFRMVIDSDKRILRFDVISPSIELKSELQPWDEGGVTITPSDVNIQCNDNGSWSLSAQYTASNDVGTTNALTVNGNAWRTDGENIILEVPDYEKNKLSGAKQIEVSQTVDAGTGEITYAATATVSYTYKNPADEKNPFVSKHETAFTGTGTLDTVAVLENGSEEQSVDATVTLKSDFTWQLNATAPAAPATPETPETPATPETPEAAPTAEGTVETAADGYWYYRKGEVVLCVVNDAGNAIFVADVEDGEAKTLSVARSSTGGKYDYSLEM